MVDCLWIDKVINISVLCEAHSYRLIIIVNRIHHLSVRPFRCSEWVRPRLLLGQSGEVR